MSPNGSHEGWTGPHCDYEARRRIEKLERRMDAAGAALTSLHGAVRELIVVVAELGNITDEELRILKDTLDEQGSMLSTGIESEN